MVRRYSNITSPGVIIFEIYRVICRFVIQLGYNTKKPINVRTLIFSFHEKAKLIVHISSISVG